MTKGKLSLGHPAIKGWDGSRGDQSRSTMPRQFGVKQDYGAPSSCRDHQGLQMRSTWSCSWCCKVEKGSTGKQASCAKDGGCICRWGQREWPTSLLSPSLILQCSYRDGPNFHVRTIDHMCSVQRGGKWPGQLFSKKMSRRQINSCEKLTKFSWLYRFVLWEAIDCTAFEHLVSQDFSFSN